MLTAEWSNQAVCATTVARNNASCINRQSITISA